MCRGRRDAVIARGRASDCYRQRAIWPSRLGNRDTTPIFCRAEVGSYDLRFPYPLPPCRATSARVTSRDVRERDTRSSTLIAALPAIDRARQRFFNWQEMIRIVAVARLCYPGVRDEPFPLRKKSSKHKTLWR